MSFSPTRFSGVLALVFCLSFPSSGGADPKEMTGHGLPGKKVDEKLFADGKKWWEGRFADDGCRSALGTAFAAYKKAPSEKTFAVLAPLVEKCGRCATRPIERVTERPDGKTLRWYVSSGACWIGDLKNAAATVEKLNKELLTVRRYPAKNGGFRALAEFFKASEAGEKAKEIDQPEDTSPFFAWISVRMGPALARYFVKNVFETKDGMLWLAFKSQPKPEKLEVEPYDGGVIPVVAARGQWYLTADGYVRYTTAADFGVPMPSLADAAARRTLLETLVELLLRGDVEV